MRYKLDSVGVKICLRTWALPFSIFFSAGNKKYVRQGVMVSFLCFYVYIGLCDTQWVKENQTDLT